MSVNPEQATPELALSSVELQKALLGDIPEAQVGQLCDDLDTRSEDLRLRLKAPVFASAKLVDESDPHAAGIQTRLPLYDATVIRDRLILDALKPQAEADGQVSLGATVKHWDNIYADWKLARAMEDIGDTFALAYRVRNRKDALQDFGAYIPLSLRRHGIAPAPALSPKGIIGAIRGSSRLGVQIVREAAETNNLSPQGFLTGCRMNGLKTETVLLEASAELGLGVLTRLDKADTSLGEKAVISQVLASAMVLLGRKEPSMAQVTNNMEAAMAIAHWGTQVFVRRYPEYANDAEVSTALERLDFAMHLRFSPPSEPAYRPYGIVPAERIRPHTNVGVDSHEFPVTVVDVSGSKRNVRHTAAEMVTVLHDIDELHKQRAATEEQQRIINEQERLERLQAAEKHAAELALAAELMQGRDRERLVELDRLVEEQANLLADFRGVSNSTLRKEHLLGKDSLDFYLQRINHLRNPEGRLSALKTYHGITMLLRDSPEIADEVLLGTQMADDTLRTMFSEVKSHLEAASSSCALLPGIDADVVWLRDNWTQFKQAAIQSETISEDDLAKVAGVLGIPPEDSPEEVPEPTEDERHPDSEWTEEQLAEFDRLVAEEAAAQAAIREKNLSEVAANAELKRLAEKLDWVVFPEYKGLTTDDLVDRVRNRFGDNPTKTIDWEIVERRSADMLLMKEVLGGTLYESSVRTFAKKDELYFVLDFEHEGAKYALAENPVYGNATYVLREDQFPLEAGETVLTVVRELRRRDAQALGARQVTHTPANGRSHPDKIIDKLDALAAKPALFAKV